MRNRILDFLIASISHRNGLDHTFDHLPIRTTWKQFLQEHRKASFSDTKAPKSLVNQGKNRYIFLWDQDGAGSIPVTPTRLSLVNSTFTRLLLFLQRSHDHISEHRQKLRRFSLRRTAVFFV